MIYTLHTEDLNPLQKYENFPLLVKTAVFMNSGWHLASLYVHFR
jgi:hypothetical protein